jgi:hypothetical protein
MTDLRFVWNGIKVGTQGKLQRAQYSDGILCNRPVGTITIYARDYGGFSAEVAAAFTIQNDTDSQTDYFEKDRIRVTPDHPLYAAVKTAMDARRRHYERRSA